MSNATEHTSHAHSASQPGAPELDTVESIAMAAPMVLPLVGGVLMFLLAFIAVYLA